MNLVSGKQNWGIRLSASRAFLVSQQRLLQAEKRSATQNKLHHTSPGPFTAVFLQTKSRQTQSWYISARVVR